MYPRTDPDLTIPARSPRWAMVGTYPPTACGIATFTRSLVTALAGRGAQVDVVRAVDAGQPWSAPGVVHGLVTGEHPGAAAARLNRYDTVVVQHEYGIYGGPDGSDLLALLDRLTVPVLTVLHTVLTDPTAHQRSVLRAVINASDLLVTMTRTARNRLVDGYHVDPATVLVIPHGAADRLVTGAEPPSATDRTAASTAPGSLAEYGSVARPRSPGAYASPGDPVAVAPARRPVVLTWGLLGRGKGIEWGIEAMAGLRDLVPRPVYLVAGQTHPRVLAQEGEAYRRLLESRVHALGVEDDVVFDNDYLDAERLHHLVRGADVVLLPYDSRDQVTSGVLTEAVAAGRPVVSTRFPHAVELLGGGMGLLVDQRDPAGIATALRRILTEPGLAARLSGRTQALAPALTWHTVAGTYLDAGESISRSPSPAFTPAPSVRLGSVTVPA
jgi:glycosyltransferase involved in cell wall biosynthesis